jgi:hypothetical protein
MGNAISIPNMTLQMKNQRQVMRIRERNAKGKKKNAVQAYDAFLENILTLC